MPAIKIAGYEKGVTGKVTPDENKVNNRRSYEKKTIKKKQLAKRRYRVQLFIYVEIIGIFGLCSFMAGKAVGVKEYRKELQVSVMENEDSGSKDSVEEEEAEVDRARILLVNRNNPLPGNYEVTLLTLPDGVNRAAKEAYEPLCNMLKAGEKEGLNFEICSSYRDAARQKTLFEEDVEVLMQAGYSYTDAYEEVAKETMPPGCSEHSTGLAFDIVALDYQMLDAGQEKTKENEWLREHCAEYGFILRYPKGKEDITSINYESWHFRYVGKEAAEYIMKNGITLEEYLE